MLCCIYFFYSYVCVVLLVFFFSSRRRHTIYLRDWSSDVCSSDLATDRSRPASSIQHTCPGVSTPAQASAHLPRRQHAGSGVSTPAQPSAHLPRRQHVREIGRASCRERV